jgi:hypothetical protein
MPRLGTEDVGIRCKQGPEHGHRHDGPRDHAPSWNIGLPRNYELVYEALNASNASH